MTLDEIEFYEITIGNHDAKMIKKKSKNKNFPIFVISYYSLAILLFYLTGWLSKQQIYIPSLLLFSLSILAILGLYYFNHNLFSEYRYKQNKYLYLFLEIIVPNCVLTGILNLFFLIQPSSYLFLNGRVGLLFIVFSVIIILYSFFEANYYSEVLPVANPLLIKCLSLSFGLVFLCSGLSLFSTNIIPFIILIIIGLILLAFSFLYKFHLFEHLKKEKRFFIYNVCWFSLIIVFVSLLCFLELGFIVFNLFDYILSFTIVGLIFVVEKYGFLRDAR